MASRIVSLATELNPPRRSSATRASVMSSSVIARQPPSTRSTISALNSSHASRPALLRSSAVETSLMVPFSARPSGGGPSPTNGEPASGSGGIGSASTTTSNPSAVGAYAGSIQPAVRAA